MCPPHPRDLHEEAEGLKTEVEARDCQRAEQLDGSTEASADTSGALTELHSCMVA